MARITFDFGTKQELYPKHYLQWCALVNQQSPFYVVNEVTLPGPKPSLRFCQPLELLIQFEKRFRSFNAENLGSID